MYLWPPNIFNGAGQVKDLALENHNGVSMVVQWQLGICPIQSQSVLFQDIEAKILCHYLLSHYELKLINCLLIVASYD